MDFNEFVYLNLIIISVNFTGVMTTWHIFSRNTVLVIHLIKNLSYSTITDKKSTHSAKIYYSCLHYATINIAPDIVEDIDIIVANIIKKDNMTTISTDIAMLEYIIMLGNNFDYIDLENCSSLNKGCNFNFQNRSIFHKVIHSNYLLITCLSIFVFSS